MDQRTKAAVTPRAIEDARQRAINLLRDAYTAKPTPIDGQTVLICMTGRIARGYDKLAIARRAGDAAAIKKLEQGIGKLTDLYNADWAAMAAAAGVTVDPASIYPPDCDCETCQAERARKSGYFYRDCYTAMVYDALAPNSFDFPPLLELVRDAKNPDARDRIWAHLKRILDAAEAYNKDCRDRGVQPNWRAALCPAEGE